VPPAFLYAIEQTAFSTWLRDSTSLFGFWFILSLHAIGMAMLVGASAIVALRLLGSADDLPLPALTRFYPLIWSGFWLQIVSGGLLLWGYPTKSLTTPAFYVKIALIAAAMVVMTRIRRRLADGEAATPARALAGWSLVLWFGAITAGRFIAYTAPYITYPADL
jgi:hypothetical protein